MPKFSMYPPTITISKLDEKPFEVDHLEFHWFWFINLELGQKSQMTAYQYPGPVFWERRERRIDRKAKIHGVECLELKGVEYDIDGNIISESTNFAKIDRGYMRSYAFMSSEGDNIRLSTWKDNGFNDDWDYDPGAPTQVVDVGKWRFIDDNHFTDGDPESIPINVNPNGVGLWELKIGDATHRCLRVLQPGNRVDGIMSVEGTMVEAFVNSDGRTMLARRYNGSRWHYGSKSIASIDGSKSIIDGTPREWTELLPDAPRIYYSDICFVLWDFSIPDTAL
jgi:hypothetical protein